MLFAKSFKGYEDKAYRLDELLNEWVLEHKADCVDIKTALSHDQNAKHGSGDLIYTVIYRADAPIKE